MRVLDLFSGLGGFSAAFLERGHEVTRIDNSPRFESIPNTIMADISELRGEGGHYDAVLASPPCECFSVASIGTHWTGGARAYIPKTAEAKTALQLVAKTFTLIEELAPRFYVIENPRGVMRKIAPRLPTATTWYCQWGETRAKPTDIWTNLPGFIWPSCRNGAADHERSPRGAKTGTQGIKTSAARALIPYAMSLTLCKIMEGLQ